MSTSPRAKSLQPKYKVYETFDQVRDDMHALFAGMQQKNFRIASVAPVASTINEGEFVLFDDGTNRRLYSKVNGTVRYSTLT